MKVAVQVNCATSIRKMNEDLGGKSPRSFAASEKTKGAGQDYSTITTSLPLRPKTSGEYISSALAGGTMNVPGVVARAT